MRPNAERCRAYDQRPEENIDHEPQEQRLVHNQAIERHRSRKDLDDATPLDGSRRRDGPVLPVSYERAQRKTASVRKHARGHPLQPSRRHPSTRGCGRPLTGRRPAICQVGAVNAPSVNHETCRRRRVVRHPSDPLHRQRRVDARSDSNENRHRKRCDDPEDQRPPNGPADESVSDRASDHLQPGLPPAAAARCAPEHPAQRRGGSRRRDHGRPDLRGTLRERPGERRFEAG